MSKTCLRKLSGNVTYDCTLPSYGIPEIYLMHVEDVTFTYSSDGTSIATVTFATGANSYKFEGYKQNIQVTSSFRSTDASGRFDVSIMFKTKLSGSAGRPLTTGKFYVMVVERGSSGDNYIWGCNSTLECSNVEYDSNANGKLVTYTLSAPDGSAGNNLVLSLAPTSKTIISKSV